MLSRFGAKVPTALLRQNKALYLPSVLTFFFSSSFIF
jgi:hypothetical protein